MPPQHIEIAETIAALKRALRRENEAPTDQPIYSATNRGNKLRKGAAYVHAGALPYPHNSEGYKQKIEHAGYTRYILERNPKRFNEYGDELEDSESDTEADADAGEENPYSDIRLEELLCPLKHPSELQTHPSLSQPFLDSALPNMVLSTEEKLRQERANLWRAKNLNRQFLGDESWMPLGNVETLGDWELFPPLPKAAIERSRKRKRDAKQPLMNGIDGRDYATPVGEDDQDISINQPITVSTKLRRDNEANHDGHEIPPYTDSKIPTEDTLMQDASTTMNGIHIKKDPQDAVDGVDGEFLGTNGVSNSKTNEAQREVQTENEDNSPESTPPPTRRITRALAAENNPTTSTAETPALSPTSTISSIDSSLLTVDPIFVLPQALNTSNRMPQILSHLGLPIEELLETRRLLTMYVQKQEESVRGYEAVLGKLIKAKRMRDTLWEWCKAEEHVGEWSDGEDWIDAEAWGLAPGELKKGRDEEEVEGVEEVGRKGKRRRNRE